MLATDKLEIDKLTTDKFATDKFAADGVKSRCNPEKAQSQHPST